MKQVRGGNELEVHALSSMDNSYSAMWGVVLTITRTYDWKDSGNLGFYVNSLIVQC